VLRQSAARTWHASRQGADSLIIQAPHPPKVGDRPHIIALFFKTLADPPLAIDYLHDAIGKYSLKWVLTVSSRQAL